MLIAKLLQKLDGANPVKSSSRFILILFVTVF